MKSLLLTSALLVATAALAQTPSPPPSPDGSKAESSETVCRIIHEIGSRLKRSRMCMTRAQWQEYRRETQRDSERAQMRRVQDR